ncbi:13439_t:CDS:10 [Cetraspora pellucida]|uniref:Protein transport protein SEC31 n=3 Tax=Cetraspora pellucida TaxID=1433469 RepID=A0A9N8ZD06_9GLOM|nr:13439_t:CDS:10 [Cetraspora pellucida]
MKLKEIPRTATFAWSPGQHLPIIATGTVAGALDASFSSTTELELFHIDIHSSDTAVELQPSAVVTSSARFDRLVWGNAIDKAYGIIAGGLENGELDLWDPEIILGGGDAEKALLLRNTAHSGNVRGLQFNPIQNNLLASAATNGEIFIWDLAKPDKPYTPGTKSPKMEEITHLAWNNQVQHILATSSTTGYTLIWDLKNKREVMHLSYAGATASLAGGYGMGSMNMATGLGVGRRGITAVAWNPDMATQIITASEDDNNPVIVVWDVRNAHAPEKVLTGHEKGILSLSWCQKDADLLLSCGKDNRTLCWNPRTAEIIGENSFSNWAFDVQWCTGNPYLLASASLDGKISVHSLQSNQDKLVQANVHDNDDPFAPIASAHQPSLALKQPPRWLRRPVGVMFGFGGKLVSFCDKASTGTAPKKHVVAISTVVTESEVVQRSIELESSVEDKSLDVFCERRVKEAANEFESENWKVLHTIFNENAREQLVKHLGFSKEDVVSQISTAIKAMNLKETSNEESKQPEINNIHDILQQDNSTESVGVVSLPSSPTDVKSDADQGHDEQFAAKSDNMDELFSGLTDPSGPSDASNFFSSGNIPDAFPVQSENFNIGSFQIYPAQESDVDKLITRSIVLGDFESAVDLCLKADRLSDAILLAGCGGQELLQRTRKTYFERRASTIPYLRLLQSIVSGDLSDIVFNADLSEWQEIVVVLCTFARPEEFGGLCNALGQRLEQEYHKCVDPTSTEEMKSRGLEYRKNAVLCFLAAGNLENVAKIWIAEQENEEKQYETVQNNQDGSKCTGLRYSYHAKTLQSLIEKVTIFRKAIDYVDPSVVQSLDSSAGESNQQYKLSALYDKYTDYAEILVSQGHLTTALKYLNLIPVEYKTATLDQNNSLAVIRERLYNSGVDVGSTKAPSFPFSQVYVGEDGETNQSIVGDVTFPPQVDPNATQAAYQQPAAQQYYNQYAYNQQPLVQNAPYQPQQQMAYNQYVPPYNPPIQNPTGYSYQQNFTGYNQPYSESNNLIPQPPMPNALVQNENVPSAEVVGAHKKNVPNWNDPPVVPPPQMNRRVAQAQVNKPSPIVSPFPTSTSPTQQKIHPPPQNFAAPPQPNIPAGLPPLQANPAAPVTTAYQPIQSMQPQTGVTSLYPPPPPNPNIQQQPSTQRPSQPTQSYYAPNQSTSTPNRVPTPSKTPTPSNKHPPGDRTHIPATQKPIFIILSNELLRARQHSPNTQKKLLDDTEKRLNVLFDALNNEEISPSVIESLLTLVRDLESRNFPNAINIQVQLMTTKMEECGKWIVGIKQLINVLKTLQ